MRANHPHSEAVQAAGLDASPRVNAADLAVYAQPAWTRYEGRVLLQLVYTIWFPERPPESANDILAGKLDGIVWRVTLAPDGEFTAHEVTGRDLAERDAEYEVVRFFASSRSLSLTSVARYLSRSAGSGVGIKA